MIPCFGGLMRLASLSPCMTKMDHMRLRELGMRRALSAMDQGQLIRFGKYTNYDMKTPNGIDSVVREYQPMADYRHEEDITDTAAHQYRLALVVQDVLQSYETEQACGIRVEFLQKLCQEIPEEGEDEHYISLSAFACLCYLREDIGTLFTSNALFFDLVRKVMAPLWQQLTVFLPTGKSTPLGHFCKVPSAVGGFTGDGCYLISAWRMLWQLVCTGHQALLLSEGNIRIVLLRLGSNVDACKEWWFDGVCGCISAKVSSSVSEYLCPPPSSAINRLVSKLEVTEMYTDTTRDWAHKIADMCSLTHDCRELHVVLQRRTPPNPVTGLTYWAPVAECAEENILQLLEETSTTLAREGAKHGHTL